MSTAICLHVLAVPHSLAISAITVLLLVGAGFFGTDWIRPFYTVWNKGAGLVARVASRLLMGVCFFIVFAAVGLAGARFSRKPPTSASSGWNRRGPQVGEENNAPSAGAGIKEAVWMRAYVRWARRSGNLWAIVLLPFLSFLSLLAKDEDDTLPTTCLHPFLIPEMNEFRLFVALIAGLVAAIVALPLVILLLPLIFVLVATRLVSRWIEPPYLLWRELIQFDPQFGWKNRENMSGFHLADDGVYRTTTDSEGWRGTASIDGSRSNSLR